MEKNQDFKAKHILFTTTPYGQGHKASCSPSSAAACRSENGYLLARYAVTLNPGDGTLKAYREINRIPDQYNPRERLAPDETIWLAYVETNPPSEWFNGQTYVDALNPKAIKKFIDTTHKKYKEAVGDSFGTTVPCIFTDEPQFATKTRLSSPFAKEDLFIPWTSDLPDTFHAKYYHGAAYAHGAGPLIAWLPELFWNLENGRPSTLRYRFHDHVCERFVSAFMDQLGGWCKDNNIFLNGHMMEEPTLESQTHSLGEAMRCYRNMSLPGIDLLSDMVEYNTVKQASSVARQNGIRGCMSELYGCTHWDFTFEGHKGCGDWQAALGITFRVPHLAWASMAGEAKRDYPASINYQSPWYREYGYVEDHFARVGVAMTRGRPVTRVAVVHPIESYWLVSGPGNDPGNQMGERDKKFLELTNWLLHGLIDFDFLSESLLPDQKVDVKRKQLLVGQCAYEAVIVPNLLTIRSTTLKILEKFAAAGGKVIVASNRPELVDAKPANDYVLTTDDSNTVPWNRSDILESVEDFVDLEIKTTGSLDPPKTLLYQMRQDGDERFVFICNTDRNNGVDTQVYLRGRWEVELLDTLSGESKMLDTRLGHASEKCRYAFTNFGYRFEGCASILLRLVPSEKSVRVTTKLQSKPVDFRDPPPFGRGLGHPSLDTLRVPMPVSVNLYGVDLVEEGARHSGLNVLMLDYARYWLNGDKTSSHVQEILALNNELLDLFDLPRKGMAWRQPWTISPVEREPKALVSLEFQFMSDFDVTRTTYLAFELAPGTVVSLNGEYLMSGAKESIWCRERLAVEQGDWFVDEAITTIAIPGGVIQYGKNTLLLSGPFGVLTPIERVYILGDFKVDPAKELRPQTLARAKIRPYNEQSVWIRPGLTLRPGLTSRDGLASVDWGNIADQGLPFYVGNLTYHCGFYLLQRSKVVLSIPGFSSPVLTVEWGRDENSKRGHVAFQPRTLDLGVLDAGDHHLSITAYGNRYNAFGHVHTPDWMTNCWPDAWRTQGWAWTEDYNVRPVGILDAPKVMIKAVASRDDEVKAVAKRPVSPSPRAPSPVESVHWEFMNRRCGGLLPSSSHDKETSGPSGLESSDGPRVLTPSGSGDNPSSGRGSWPRFVTPPDSLLELRASSELSDYDQCMKVHHLVHEARNRLHQLWDVLRVPDEERRQFQPYTCAVFNATLLGLHEIEIARLRRLVPSA